MEQGERSKYCRDCSYCTERNESQGKCWAKDMLVAFDDIADDCSSYRSRISSIFGFKTLVKYGRIRLPKAG